MVKNSDQSKLPLNGKTVEEFLCSDESNLYDLNYDAKDVDLSAKDVIVGSSNNFYEGVNQKEVEDFYAKMKEADPKTVRRSVLILNWLK